MENFTSITQIRNAHERAGGFFFSDGALAFFRSKIYDDVYPGNVFLTSERPPYGPRVYRVRQLDPKNPGNINAITGWLDSLREARREAERYSGGWVAALRS